MGDIDWGTEVKKLERECSGLPPEPSAASVKAKKEAERRAKEQKEAATARFGATARLVVVVALFGALFIWPYQRACGAGLFAYMAVEVVIAAGAVWVAEIAWRHRLGRIHVASLLTLLGALVLLAVQVMPRLGYDKAGAPPKQWWCASR